MEDFLNNDGIRYLGGCFALIIGLLIVNTHNVWEASWVVIITLIGWLGLIKGICVFMFPENLKKFADAYQKKSTLLTVQLCFTLLFGVFLSYKGYFSY